LERKSLVISIKGEALVDQNRNLRDTVFLSRLQACSSPPDASLSKSSTIIFGLGCHDVMALHSSERFLLSARATAAFGISSVLSQSRKGVLDILNE
jgi:hypothetical protein